MNENFIILANFLAKVYFPKQKEVKSSKEILNEINIRLDKINEKLGTSIKGAISDTKLRDIINYIRSNNLCTRGEICANGKGYFISEYKEDVLEQIESMERRISGMVNAINGMRKNLYKWDKAPIKSVKMDYNKRVPEGDLFDSL